MSPELPLIKQLVKLQCISLLVNFPDTIAHRAVKTPAEIIFLWKAAFFCEDNFCHAQTSHPRLVEPLM